MTPLIWIAATVLLAVAALAGYRVMRQQTALAAMKLTGPTAIDEAGFVQIGGIPQWISIRGESDANPVLVILHGGPGSAFQMISYEAFRPWERDFTVVQWDQRGAGRTYARNGAKGSGDLTIDRFVTDGIEVVEYALAQTGRAKAIVLGISWGSILGMEMARRRPDLFHAYVGGGQVVDMTANEAVGYDGLVERLKGRGAAKALARLQRIGPPPYVQKQLLQQRRILMGNPPASEKGMIRRLLPALLFAPQADIKDLLAWFGGQKFSIDRLYDALLAYSDIEADRPVPVPMVLIQGDEDIQTPTVLARAYFDKLQASHKEFVLIPGGGHSAVMAMPDAFLAALKQHVRPLA